LTPVSCKGLHAAMEREGFVEVDGAEIFYRAQGQGPVCLFPNGIGTTPYERQTALLRERFCVVYADMRGSGRSTGDPSALTFETLADDLEAIRTEIGAPRVAILGHSILGILAVEYARRRPQSVSHAILVGTPPSGDMARLAARAASFFDEDASEDRKQVLRDSLARLPASASMAETLLAQTPKRFFDARTDAAPLFAGASSNPAFILHMMRTLAPAWQIDAGPGELRAPLFIALGRYDYAVPYVLWDGAAAGLDATVRVFERSGHQPFCEEPEAFAAAVTAWMAARPRPGAPTAARPT
jgi:proline iminopeptidase